LATPTANYLARAQRLAEDTRDTGDGMCDANLKRIEDYKEKVNTLADKLEIQGEIVREGWALCQRLVENQLLHAKECPRGKDCRLNYKHRSAALTAAGVLKEAMRKHNTDRLFEELKTALRKEDVDASDTKKLGECTQIVKDILKRKPFACEEEAAPPAIADSGAMPTAASGSRGGDGSVAVHGVTPPIGVGRGERVR